MRYPSPGFVILLVASGLAFFSHPTVGQQPDPASRTHVERHQEVKDALQAGRYDEAEDLARKYWELAAKEWGDVSSQAGDLLDSYVLARMGNGKTDDETLTLAREAVRIREKLPDSSPTDLAWSLRALADAHRRRSEYADASREVGRAIEALEGTEMEESVAFARLLSLRGICERRLGNLEVAKSLLQRSAALHEKVEGPDFVLRGVSLGNLANVLQRMGDLSAALELHREALRITEKNLGSEHERIAPYLANVAIALYERGDFDEARLFGERVLAIDQRSLRPGHPRIGLDHRDLALYSHQLGDVVTALHHAEKALEIAVENDPEGETTIRALSDFGMIADLGGLEQRANELFDRAIHLCEVGSPSAEAWSESLRQSAEALYWQGETREAESRLRRAIQAADEDPNLRYTSRVKALRLLGVVLVDQGEFEEAATVLEETLSELESSAGQHPSVVSTRYYLGMARQGLGDPESAFSDVLAALDADARHVRGMIDALSETMAVRYATSRPPALDLGISLVGELDRREAATALWDRLVVSRGMVLDELAARHRRGSGTTSVPEGTWERVRSARERLAYRTLAGPEDDPEAHLEELESLEREKLRAERDLAERLMGSEDPWRAWESAAAVTDALSPGDALVSFVRYHVHENGSRLEPAYAALVRRGGEAECELVELGDAAQLETAISEWWVQASWPGDRSRGFSRVSSDPQSRLGDYRRAGQELREALWDPVASSIDGVRRVFLVPAGEIHQVSLPSLPTETGRFVVEDDVTFHTLSTERGLLPGRLTRRGQGLLSIGGADFEWADETLSGATGALAFRGDRSSCGHFRALDFSPLPGAREEAHEVARIWSEASSTELEPVVLVGSAAAEDAFKRLSPGKRNLHLATHGFFLGRDCAGLTNEDSERQPALLRTERDVVRENPLVLSGLAFAGANQRRDDAGVGDDGIVTAEEIAALDLGTVEWAVLSACETGAGTVRSGEGVFGLRRAFEIAGVRSIVMSLWSVDDESTRRWMKELYRARFTEGRGTAEAVREASLTILEELRESGEPDHPFRWGAFQVAGSWE